MPVKSSNERLTALNLEERARFLSPLCQVDEKNGEVVLIHGEIDSVVAPVQSQNFYDRMQELSKTCQLHMIEKTNHAFLLTEYVKDQTACKIGIDIINQCLK